MRFFVGTSGFSYKEWKGSFYPEKLPQKDMLRYYAERFSTVEMNNTFYRMPTEANITSWAEQTPESFRFVIKAPKAITHDKRLKGVEALADQFLDATSAMKGRLGPLLFQLPPNFKKDLSRLEPFLGHLGGRARCAFEFRHESWYDEEVFACLRAHACALCAADVDDVPSTDLTATADWGYIRLRRVDYSDEQLGDWVRRLQSLPWGETYVFFKHEDAGTGPRFARRFLDLIVP